MSNLDINIRDFCDLVEGMKLTIQYGGSIGAKITFDRDLWTSEFQNKITPLLMKIGINVVAVENITSIIINDKTMDKIIASLNQRGKIGMSAIYRFGATESVVKFTPK